jgi:hypothetical protein
LLSSLGLSPSKLRNGSSGYETAAACCGRQLAPVLFVARPIIIVVFLNCPGGLSRRERILVNGTANEFKIMRLGLEKPLCFTHGPTVWAQRLIWAPHAG